MPIGLTAAIVVNEALQHIASQTTITSLTDGSAAANAALVVYNPTIEVLMREIDPDFARYTIPLALSGAAIPPPPWTFEYLYPTDCMRLRQVRPPRVGVGALADLNDPAPIKAQVAFDVIANVSTKVILTNQANAMAVYTSGLAPEATWDSAFADAVVRRLANPLAMALSGRPDFAEKVLMQAAQMAATAEAIDEGGFRRGGAG